eukprot:scaffold16502_cov177-Amphora_coffeaeformis.AAC.7
MSSSSDTNSNTKYFSIEAPHKPRRRSYFWTILISLAVLGAALVAGVTFRSTSLSQQTLLSEPSTGLAAEDPNNTPKLTTRSYQVDMDKTTWPELVGQDATIAKQTIQGENPGISMVQILPKDSFVTMDYSTQRVRIFVNEDNTVASVPRVG